MSMKLQKVKNAAEAGFTPNRIDDRHCHHRYLGDYRYSAV